jgi:hypothetical protein
VKKFPLGLNYTIDDKLAIEASMKSIYAGAAIVQVYQISS